MLMRKILVYSAAVLMYAAFALAMYELRRYLL